MTSTIISSLLSGFAPHLAAFLFHLRAAWKLPHFHTVQLFNLILRNTAVSLLIKVRLTRQLCSFCVVCNAVLNSNRTVLLRRQLLGSIPILNVNNGFCF